MIATRAIHSMRDGGGVAMVCALSFRQILISRHRSLRARGASPSGMGCAETNGGDTNVTPNRFGGRYSLPPWPAWRSRAAAASTAVLKHCLPWPVACSLTFFTGEAAAACDKSKSSTLRVSGHSRPRSVAGIPAGERRPLLYRPLLVSQDAQPLFRAPALVCRTRVGRRRGSCMVTPMLHSAVVGALLGGAHILGALAVQRWRQTQSRRQPFA